MVKDFDRYGFLVIKDALTPQEIGALNRTIDCDLEKYPSEWVELDESFVETTSALSRTADFDFTIENPIPLSILRDLIGPDITFEEFEIIIRDATKKVRDLKGWHRDLTRDYDRRMEIEYLSLIYYLTDVSQNDHCFSIIPETHNRLVDLKPEEVVPGSEFDVIGPAGTAIIFHGRSIHGGKLKPSSRQRRTLHVYYWRRDRPRASEWTDIPKRLYEKVDPALPPRLYSKWCVTEVFDGVGKKPRDLDPAMSVADMLREVQRRANQAPVTRLEGDGRRRPSGEL